MKLIILGGDVRLSYTADRLSRKHEVYTYGQSDRDMLPDGKCDAAVLGIPASRDGININAPLCDEPIPLSLLTALLKPHGIVIGGMITPAVKNFCAKNEFFCEDHYADEAVMLRNAVPSAEGALAVGINATPVQMLGQKVLILGCEVTVAARSREKRAKARMSGCHAVGFDALCNTLPEVTLIYNTVPCAVIGESELSAFDSEAVYIELASEWGIDKTAMKNYDGKARIIRAGGLPSRTAPVTAGEIIADCVEEILETYIDKISNCDKERGGNREP